MNPDQIEDLCRRVLEAHPERVEAYRQGDEGLLGFFVGQVLIEGWAGTRSVQPSTLPESWTPGPPGPKPTLESVSERIHKTLIRLLETP